MGSPTIAERDLEGGSSKKARTADRRQIWRYICLGSVIVASDILEEGRTRKESISPFEAYQRERQSTTTRPAGPLPDLDYMND